MRSLVVVALAVGSLVMVWLLATAPTRVQNESGPISAPTGTYDPVRAGEPVPDGFRQLLARDAILPVYNPTFRSAAETEWGDDALVIGVERAGDAKAYPVSFLNRREMVIDWIGGTPILVTW